MNPLVDKAKRLVTDLRSLLPDALITYTEFKSGYCWIDIAMGDADSIIMIEDDKRYGLALPGFEGLDHRPDMIEYNYERVIKIIMAVMKGWSHASVHI